MAGAREADAARIRLRPAAAARTRRQAAFARAARVYPQSARRLRRRLRSAEPHATRVSDCGSSVQAHSRSCVRRMERKRHPAIQVHSRSCARRAMRKRRPAIQAHAAPNPLGIRPDAGAGAPSLKRVCAKARTIGLRRLFARITVPAKTNQLKTNSDERLVPMSKKT